MAGLSIAIADSSSGRTFPFGWGPRSGPPVDESQRDSQEESLAKGNDVDTLLMGLFRNIDGLICRSYGIENTGDIGQQQL